MKNKWTKKKEQMYEDLCLGEEYDEEYCYDFVEREDDSDWDDGEPEEERYI